MPSEVSSSTPSLPCTSTRSPEPCPGTLLIATETAAPPSVSPETCTVSGEVTSAVRPLSTTSMVRTRVATFALTERNSPRQNASASSAWPEAIESVDAPLEASTAHAKDSRRGPAPGRVCRIVAESTSPT